MKGRRSENWLAPIHPGEIDPQLPMALEVATQPGDSDPELMSILVRALQLPDLAARLTAARRAFIVDTDRMLRRRLTAPPPATRTACA
jgi:hypothetical protein